MSISSQDDRKLDAYYELAKEIRGTFIEQAIWIDHILSDILAHYFCADKKKRALLFSEVIAGTDFRFSTRITLLFDILQNGHPDIFKKYGNLKDKLDKLRRFRNRLAHSHLKATHEEIEKAQNGVIIFCFYEDGVSKEQSVSKTELRTRLSESSEVMGSLLELRRELIPNYTEQSD